MKKTIMTALAALSIAAPSFALAAPNQAIVQGRANVATPIVQIGTRANVVAIDGPDRDHRPDVLIVNNDRDNNRYDRRDYGRYDRRENDRHNRYDNRFYRNNHARYFAPARFERNTRCGWGEVSYRLPSGRFVTDDAFMCRDRHGNWEVVNR